MESTLDVLLVEDSPTDSLLTEDALSSSRFRITRSQRLGDALELLAAQRFDVILLDLGLPDSQGLATLRALRSKNPHAAVVVLTGKNDGALARMALTESGASRCLIVVDYLQKIPLSEEHTGLDAKERVDSHVLALRQLARDLKSPVLAISSLSRAGDGSPQSLNGFKESGDIEYTADVAMKLGTWSEKGSQEKTSNCPDLALRLVKNRNGESGGAVRLKFEPEFMTFSEA